MTETSNNSIAQLRAQFWSSPNDSLLLRDCVAAAFHRNARWLWDHEKANTAPPRIRIGKLTLYRKQDVLNHWVVPVNGDPSAGSLK
jgi:hypothetical protein